LRASAKGKAGEGDLDLALLTRSGRIDRLDATRSPSMPSASGGVLCWPASADGRAPVSRRRPGWRRLTGARPSAEAGQQSTPPLALGIEGDLAGLTVSTPRPILFDALDPVGAGRRCRRGRTSGRSSGSSAWHRGGRSGRSG
jgi:hypothetical protein